MRPRPPRGQRHRPGPISDDAIHVFHTPAIVLRDRRTFEDQEVECETQAR